MNAALSRTRPQALLGAALALGLLAAMPSLGTAHAASGAPSRLPTGCPKAESLVSGTKWHKHTLAPGVVMTAGTRADSRGTVNLHVLRVDLRRKSVSVRPLIDSVAERSPLSVLARGHRRLVAATNTGYFDFFSGAPTDPVIVAGAPLVISTAHQLVVGLDSAGRVEAGNVWLASTLTAGKQTYPVSGINEAYPTAGIALYTSKWGSARVPGHRNLISREVRKGAVTAPRQLSHARTVPHHGSMLVARGPAASSWLESLPDGTKVSTSSVVKTNAAHPFVQAYGVGERIVATAGVARTGFSCNSSNTTQPARTAIGFAHHGRTLILAMAADRRYTDMHGLDEDQMSALMVQLGADQAYAFDGSGSTELLARLRGTSSLRLQTYPADGQERRMPLGLGIVSTAVRPS